MPDFSKPEDWSRLQEIFYRALEAAPEERAHFLDEACGDDAALRDEVQSLLDAAAQPPGFLARQIETAARAYSREAEMQLQPGRALGPYRVVSLVGAGGMGQVYLAEDTRLGRRVALKTLAPDIVRNPRGLQRFEQEARAASALNHPNILTIYEVGESEGAHFIASEFIDGPTLRGTLSEGAVGVRRAVAMAVQIVSGLEAAHAAGIVHRDIKPENILIRSDGIAKIVDFGIAKLCEQQEPRRMLAAASGHVSPTTQTGMRLGTPRYMSPEQARGLPVDARTDIFSAGVVIYEMVAGKSPFDGETDGDVVAELLKTDPPPLDRAAPAVPGELARIVAKAMCKECAGRYQNAAGLLSDLKALQNELEFQERLRTDQPASPARRPTPRRWVTAALGLVVVAAAGYFGWNEFAKPSAGAAHRLAILPFRNIKSDAATDFLGFSLADAIITKLGYVSSLIVIPSSAIEGYRNRAIDPRQAGAALKVDTLLTGSYVKDGDDLRITAQLIDVKSMNILWGDTIDLPYGKLFTVDDRVAEKIISGLELTLTPTETAHLKLDVPRANTAYEDYLRGVDLYSNNDFDSSIAMLEKSVAIDPGYALAWAHLGQAYEANASLQFGGREQYRKALEAYQRSLKLNPALIEPSVYMANLFTDSGRVEEAVPLLRRALETNRNSASAHWELGYAYRFAGLLEESVRECERARQIDPSVKITSSAINAYFYLGRYDEWLASLPHSDAAYILFYRGFGEYYKHDSARALEDFEHAFENDPALLQAEVGKALAYGLRHETDAGLRLLHSTEAKINDRGVTDAEGIYKVAQAYAMLGDRASAIRMLKQSVDGGFFPYPYFESDPLLDPVRRMPEFTALMERARVRHEQFKARFAP